MEPGESPRGLGAQEWRHHGQGANPMQGTNAHTPAHTYTHKHTTDNLQIPDSRQHVFGPRDKTRVTGETHEEQGRDMHTPDTVQKQVVQPPIPGGVRQLLIIKHLSNRLIKYCQHSSYIRRFIRHFQSNECYVTEPLQMLSDSPWSRLNHDRERTVLQIISLSI